MNRLTKTFLPLCLALIAAPAMCQDDGTNPAPRLSIAHNTATGIVSVSAAAMTSGPGALFLLGSLDGATAKLGMGLPSILAHGQLLAMSFTEGETIGVSAGWPPVHVLLQAVYVRFASDGPEIFASGIALIGEGPITDAMVDEYRANRADRGEQRARPAKQTVQIDADRDPADYDATRK